MIFESLWESAQRGELILVDGGFCHFHKRRDGQLTIREMIVLPGKQGQGVGRMMLAMLVNTPGITSVLAKCPAELPANGWYERMGFVWEDVEYTRSGRALNLWRLTLPRASSLS